MTEYAIILALVAVVVIATLTVVGGRSKSAVCAAGTGVSGGPAGCSLYGFGLNDFGQLGDGSTGNVRTSAVLAQNLQMTRKVIGGWHNTIALAVDGGLWISGPNYSGQRGIGAGGGTVTFQQLPGYTALDVDAGGDNYCMVRSDGTVMTWGQDYYGDGVLGDGSATVHTDSTPTAVQGLTGVFSQVVCSSHNGAALRPSDGTVWTWGDNSSGQLGNGSAVTNSATAVKANVLTNVQQIAGGHQAIHLLALDASNTIYAWGNNSQKQLGFAPAATNFPQPVPGITGRVASVVAGANSSFAVMADGTVWDWGKNATGTLCDSTSSASPQATPEHNPTLSGVASMLSGGNDQSIVLSNGGAVFTCGTNNQGQLGQGTQDVTAHGTPTQVAANAVIIGEAYQAAYYLTRG